MRFQIVYKTIVCGVEKICLCGRETKSGSWCICFDAVEAAQRVTELKEAGYEAWFERVPLQGAWFD